MVLPGQGSQSLGMQADLATEYAVVQDTYTEASEILGYDLWQLVQDGPAEKLAETVFTQPAMLAAGIAAYRVWQAAGGTRPRQMAGHSLGEYTALVCAGAVGFADAMKVVKRRSELMQEAVPVGIGAMAEPYVDSEDIRNKLSAQVYTSVLWVRTIRAMIDGGATSIIECGPGKVLAGLVRRIDKGTTVTFIDNTGSLQKALQS